MIEIPICAEGARKQVGGAGCLLDGVLKAAFFFFYGGGDWCECVCVCAVRRRHEHLGRLPTDQCLHMKMEGGAVMAHIVSQQTPPPKPRPRVPGRIFKMGRFYIWMCGVSVVEGVNND